MSEKELDSTQIMQLLTELGQELKANNVEASIGIIGGAAIALTFQNARSTQDVDAIVKSSNNPLFYQIAAKIGAKHGIREDWLGDDITQFISRSPQGKETELTIDGLQVYVASAEHLLALKTRAATARMSPKDNADLVYLFDYLGFDTPHQAAELVAKQFSDIYQDNFDSRDYKDTIENALIIHDLENGIDPLIRQRNWKTSELDVTRLDQSLGQMSDDFFDDPLDL